MKERILGWAAAVLILGSLYAGLILAPPDAVQGNVQRIMYLHIPSVVTAYLAFAVVFVASAAYLWRRRLRDDALAHASAVVGVLFTALTIAGGAIWGKPTWGAWWSWDARLTTTAILLFIYVGYLMLRSLIEDREQRALYAAVLGIVGCLDIPLIHFSVYWWRTLHQPPSMFRPQPPAIAGPMLSVVLLSMIAFIALYSYLLLLRLRARRLEDRLFELRRKVAESG